MARNEALSRSRIINAAVRLLDSNAAGDDRGLTLRSLTTELATGSGAIYHHVANMVELREAAASEMLRAALPDSSDADAHDALRQIATAIFESIEAHPWLAPQLTRNPFQPAVLLMWKAIGVQLARIGLVGAALTTAGSTMTSFILGSAAQQPRSLSPSVGMSRDDYLKSMARSWAESDDHPIVKTITTHLLAHDDRDQFREGLEIILRGISTTSSQGAR